MRSAARRLGFLSHALPLIAAAAAAQMDDRYQPNADSKKYPVGSALERKARMKAIAQNPFYTRKFDLSGLPDYVPLSHPTGTIRLCGNNYIGDSPLGGWWQEAFAKYQPNIKLDFNLQTSAAAMGCLSFNLADIGITHQPSFYDYLTFQRLKGRAPIGIVTLTGSYDVVGWQNNFVIVVNKENPLTKITLTELDGIFGSQRAGGWIKTVWHPEFARGPEKDIRTWGKVGLTGKWATAPIRTYGFSLRYSTALEFSDLVLSNTDKWNENLLAFGNYDRPNGKTYLEADQIVDHVAADPDGIGYVRFHQHFPENIKVLPVAKTIADPYVTYSMDSLFDHTYPLWTGQSFWFDAEPGKPIKPELAEFLRFILSRQAQELVQKDGKYIPLDALKSKEGLATVAQYSK